MCMVYEEACFSKMFKNRINVGSPQQPCIKRQFMKLKHTDSIWLRNSSGAADSKEGYTDIILGHGRTHYYSFP